MGETLVPFGATDFTAAFTAAKDKHPTLVVLNLYGWDLVHALKAYSKLEFAKEKIGVGGMIAGEQIGRPLGYANNAGIWAHLGSKGQHGRIQAVYSSSRRQIQSHANFALLSWVCRHDADP